METCAGKQENKPMKGDFKFENKLAGDAFGTGKEMPLTATENPRPADKVSAKGQY